MEGKNYIVRWMVVRVITFTLCAACIGYLAGRIIIKPMYASHETMVVQYDKTFEDKGINTIKQFDNDCKHIVKSYNVLSRAIGNLGLSMNAEDLDRYVKVTVEPDSHVVKVTVRSENAADAKLIADAIVRYSKDELVAGVGATGIKVIDEATVSTKRTRDGIVAVTIIAGILGAVLSTLYMILINKKDKYIRTEEDLVGYLGINVLTTLE